jgi:NADH:ubiquinone oxidoreductase subunit K
MASSIVTNLALALFLAAVGYVGLIFPEVDSPALSRFMSPSTDIAIALAAAEVEAVLASFTTTSRTKGNQNRHI